ncbi:MAG: hypothetical protein ABII16_04135 [Patescibacteria group bacterium]
MIKRRASEHKQVCFSRNKIIYKKLFYRTLLSLFIVGILYLWVFGIFSNINNFWKLFGKSATTQSLDTRPPFAPYLKSIPIATNKDTVNIEGISEKGAKIELFLNEQKVEETICDNDGTFNFGAVKIQPSKNSLYAIATDEAQNKSLQSEMRDILFDNEKPKISIIEPSEGETISSPVRTAKVEGSTEPNATVTINGTRAIIDENGNFWQMIYPVEGGNKITALAIDTAGNETKIERYFSFEED